MTNNRHRTIGYDGGIFVNQLLKKVELLGRILENGGGYDA